MYRIGDYVYCDDPNSSSSNNSNQNEPYQIRQIEELFKTSQGNTGVEASVVIFYRRREISSNLASLADRQAARAEEDDADSNYSGDAVNPGPGEPSIQAANGCAFQADFADLKPDERYYIKHRELFLSKNVERIPATRIRGKCQSNAVYDTQMHQFLLFKSQLVSLKYNGRNVHYRVAITCDDTFDSLCLYRYRYDHQQKSLNYDRNETRVGPEFQAEIPDLLSKEEQEKDMAENYENMPEQVWSAERNPLSEKEIEQVVTLARSVGLFSRALDCSGATVRSTDWTRSGVHISAAAACRDITMTFALSLLHKNDYNIARTAMELVPPTGPVLCRDELEDWSPSEAFLFEQALEKYGKDFNAIQKHAITWRSVRSIIEYYYLWKTTDRYANHKRARAQSSDGSTNKLKQLFLSTFKDPSPFALKPSDVRARVAQCDSCVTKQNEQWYRYPSSSLLNNYNGSGLLLVSNSSIGAHASALASARSVMTGLLCEACHTYWKHYGGLKWNNVLNQHGLLAPAAGNHDSANAGPSHRDQQQRALLQHCPHCEREFRGRHQMSRHLSFNHGYFGGGLDQHGHAEEGQVRDNFLLQTSRRTRLARHFCSSNSENDLVPLRQMWRSKFLVNLAALERDLICRKGELRLVETMLNKFRQTIYEKNAKTMAVSRKAADPPQTLGDEYSNQVERFPSIGDVELERFFNGLSTNAASHDVTPLSGSIQFNLRPLNQQKYIKRPKLFTRSSTLVADQPNPPPSPVQPQHSAQETEPHRPPPSSLTEPLCYIEGIDGVYVAISVSGRSARRRLPIRLLRKCARHPWHLLRNEFVSAAQVSPFIATSGGRTTRDQSRPQQPQQRGGHKRGSLG